MKTVDELKTELLLVNQQINRLQPSDSHVDGVARSFHLGMVGGSGRNVHRLNKRKAAYIDRTVAAAVKLCPLYEKRSNLEKQISDIETGVAAQRQETVIDQRIKRAAMWRNLKAGDELPLGNSNGNPTIKTKNRLSVITTGGTKWTAAEVIGREASRFI